MSEAICKCCNCVDSEQNPVFVELCDKCHEQLKEQGYDPFYQAENCGKDLRGAE
jgi:hypothetical protein